MSPIAGYRLTSEVTLKPPRGVACDPFDLYPLEPGPELERLAVFAASVPGNKAAHVWPKVRALLDERPRAESPFAFLAALCAAGALDGALRRFKVGRYRAVGARLAGLARLPAGWGWTDLLDVPGVNYKTAKFVGLYTYPGGQHACLDRHVLRPMASWPLVRRMGIRVPESSPQDPDEYAVLETVYLLECARAKTTPWELDRLLWRRGAGFGGADG